MLRKLGFGLTALVSMTPGIAAALGVGEYELNSYLNQPLDMEVSLHEVGDLTADEILVNLASQAEFDAAGVDRAYFLNRIDFAVELQPGDKATLHITTDQPVREPYLNFLVEFLWPTGRLMREYTVLLDPPSYADSAVTAAPTISRAPQPVTRSEPEPQQEPARSVAPTQATQAEPESAPPMAQSQMDDSGPRNAYTVKASDTMWRIALDNRPTDSVSVQQMLVAIQSMNPDAFINNNVNLVREGTVLRIPNEQEVRNISTRSALTEVADQNRKWREMLEARGVPVPQQRAQLDGSRQVAGDDEAAQGTTSGQVKLVSPESTAGVSDGDSTGSSRDGSANTAVLENELAIRDENLDRLDRENSELKSRLDELEAQNQTSEQLLKLRSDQIAQLQEELRKLREAQGMDVEAGDEALMGEPASAEDVATLDEGVDPEADNAAGEPEAGAQNDDTADELVAGDDVAAESESDADPTTESDAAAPAMAGDAEADGDASDETVNTDQAVTTTEPAVEKAPEVVKPKPVAPAEPPAQQQSGIVDVLMENLLYIGLALVAILVLVMVLLRGKKKETDEDEGADTLFEDIEDSEQDEFGLNLDDDSAVAVADGQDDDAMPAEQGGSQDPLEDVEVYVAYGRYPQAVDFLRNEINKHPERADLKVRLLELLKEMNDDAAFSQQSSVFAGTSAEVDAAIARLGGDAAVPASDDDELSLDDLEMGLSSDLDDSSVPTMQADEPSSDNREEGDELADFDFELDNDDDQASTDDTLVMEASDDTTSADDFSFDIDDDSTPAADEEPALSDEDKRSLGASSLLELDDVGSSSMGDDDGDTQFGDLNLDDMNLEFEESSDSADSKEELDLSLDDLDLDGDNESTADDTLTDLDLELDEAERSLSAAGAEEQSDLTELDLELPDEPSAPATAEAEKADSLEDLLGDDDLELELDSPEETPADDAADDLELGSVSMDSEPDDVAEPEPVTKTPASTESPADSDVLSDEDDFDFLGETDENATKLDLAKAYIDMGDADGARDILNEVISEGNDQQQAEARELMGQVG
ncbi:MAG: FimV/HubP family polar landmark protein [Pseudomonadota bacterium]|nr:FimV/HubP family polar landmark protein [Pseudomonadota bacterium]